MQYILHFPVNDRLENRVARIKDGDPEERESFIQDYIPFIVKTVSGVTNRYIEYENSDEYIIGLEGFNEAIDKYDFRKGKFISFASLVIKSRVTDYLRKQEKFDKELLQCLSEEAVYNKSECDHKISDATDRIALRNEVEEFENLLKAYNITFGDLVKGSPKHKDTRQSALCIAQYIISKDELKQELLKKRRLPITKLINELNISEKLIYRSKSFIIAAVLVMDSNMDCLKGYIPEAGGGVGNGL